MILLLILSWTTPIRVYQSDWTSSKPSIVVDKNYRIHIAWVEYLDYDASRFIFYSYSDDTGKTWHTTPWAGFIPHKNHFMYPQLCVDSLNTLHMFFDSDNYGDIMWQYMDGDTWTDPIDVSLDSNTDSYEDIALCDPNGVIWLIWDEIYVIRCRRYKNGVWGDVEDITPYGYYRHPNATIDRLGRVHLVYARVDSERVCYRVYNPVDSMWGPEELIEKTGMAQGFPDVIVDSLNNPYVFFHMASDTMYYTYRDTNGWRTPEKVINKKEAVGEDLDYAQIDSRGNIHLFLIDVEGSAYSSEIDYIFYNGSGWSEPYEISAGLSGTNLFCDSYITPDDRLFAAWTRDSTPGIDGYRDIYFSTENVAGIRKKNDGYVNTNKLVFGSSVTLDGKYNDYKGIFMDITGRGITEGKIMNNRFHLDKRIKSGVYLLLIKKGEHIEKIYKVFVIR